MGLCLKLRTSHVRFPTTLISFFFFFIFLNDQSGSVFYVFHCVCHFCVPWGLGSELNLTKQMVFCCCVSVLIQCFLRFVLLFISIYSFLLKGIKSWHLNWYFDFLLLTFTGTLSDCYLGITKFKSRRMPKQSSSS